jgi:hypothetical protein
MACKGHSAVRRAMTRLMRHHRSRVRDWEHPVHSGEYESMAHEEAAKRVVAQGSWLNERAALLKLPLGYSARCVLRVPSCMSPV